MNNESVAIYLPNQRQKTGFLETWVIMFKNIIMSRELILQLFKRDFLMAYKKSYLGLAWIFISPLVGIASWIILQYANILSPGDTGIPFPVYILIGSSIWGLFMGFYSAAASTLNAGSGFILQVKYPHEVLLVKQMAQHLANFLITFTLNLFIILLFGVVPDWKILLFPLLIIPMIFLGTGLGLFLSVISVVATDLSNIFGIFMGFVFYITPIIYVQDTIQSTFLRTLIELNPLTYIVVGVRDIILYGEMQHPIRFLIVGVISFLFFMLSWRLFYVSEEKVIEKLI